MRLFNELGFEDFVTNTSSEDTAFYTKTELNPIFGQADQFAWQLVMDDFSTGSINVTARMEHSADGRNFKVKANSSDAASGTVTNPASPVVASGYDDGATPALAFVRFAIYFTGTGMSGHCKLYVTGRQRRM